MTIGRLARRSGVPVRTIRFWSDSGVLPESDRSLSGYRMYDASAVARLDLVRTLRELGMGLDDVRAVLAEKTDLAEVAAAHVAAIDDRIRSLRVQRAVCTLLARGGHTTEELRLMNDLTRLSAEDRQRMIDEFVAEAFAGIDDDAPGAGIARAMRALPPELPDEPTTAQVEAWVELADLVADPAFKARVREMAVAGANRTEREETLDPQAVIAHAGPAQAAGLDPAGAEGQQVAARIVGELPVAEAHEMADMIRTFTDVRVERYWTLLCILQDREPFPLGAPAFEWLAEALAARS
ncbi:MerR family transcriptional regulator [Pseudonocardia sp. WMMC193]|uniref:MerR family transcriptional regulator n=1 Tax=Pseudonocardia sp. WMMC193 TaxID=2911965 RepID=UPI001F1AA60B|nr:MerR family transcriptional regulator [Pseudonocardia sp. WMMC193]MCF7548110.1 MerR family transcriptional regulator [Pseudonocardia sp. WMMC193]